MLKRLVREQEEEVAGLLAPKSLRDAALELDDALTAITEGFSEPGEDAEYVVEHCGDFRVTEDFLKATTAYDGYADPNSALGVLNTALTLQWNLGHLENQLVMLDDVTYTYLKDADKSDPLNQLRVVGYKLYYGTLLSNVQFFARIESVSGNSASFT